MAVNITTQPGVNRELAQRASAGTSTTAMAPEPAAVGGDPAGKCLIFFLYAEVTGQSLHSTASCGTPATLCRLQSLRHSSYVSNNLTTAYDISLSGLSQCVADW